MRRLGLWAAAAGLLAVTSAGVAVLLRVPPVIGAQPGTDVSADRVAQGRVIATAADCIACHTAPGGKPYAGGLTLTTPFGTLATPNITPDRATGIGTYTEAHLRRALRDGIGADGKRLYPAMPYTAYSKMTDTDIGLLWAYLTTIDPVENQVDVNRLPFPFNIRLSLAGWNLLNFDHSGPADPRADKPAEWNRGRYLVDALGHCGACHTPKNLVGGDRTAQYLQGGALEGWYAPNITGAVRNGIGGWPKEQIVAYLRSGANHQAVAAGPMAEAVENSTSKMEAADLDAIATYLLDLPAPGAEPPPAVAVSDARMQAGGAIFKDSCAACHYDSGQGAASLFPALAGNPAVQQADAASLIRVVLIGARGGATAARPTAPAMPPLGWRLGDEEVAAVLTYIRNAWGNAAGPVTAGTVGAARKRLATPGS